MPLIEFNCEILKMFQLKFIRKKAVRSFDTIHDILRPDSHKDKIALIWRQLEPTHMTQSRTDGLKRFIYLAKPGGVSRPLTRRCLTVSHALVPAGVKKGFSRPQ